MITCIHYDTAILWVQRKRIGANADLLLLKTSKREKWKEDNSNLSKCVQQEHLTKHYCVKNKTEGDIEVCSISRVIYLIHSSYDVLPTPTNLSEGTYQSAMDPDMNKPVHSSIFFITLQWYLIDIR